VAEDHVGEVGKPNGTDPATEEGKPPLINGNVARSEVVEVDAEMVSWGPMLMKIVRELEALFGVRRS